MSPQETVVSQRPMVVTSTKSVGIQILLVFLFGPVGLFYSTVKGALIMLIGVPIAFTVLAAATGIGAASAGSDGAAAVGLLALGGEIFLLVAVMWVGSFIWGVLAVNKYNANLLQRATG